MDDQSKLQLDPKRFQKLQTHNVPTDDVENTNGTS